MQPMPAVSSGKVLGDILRALGFANDQFEHLLESYAFVDHRNERVRIKPRRFCRRHESLDCMVGRDVMRFVKTVKNGFHRVAGLGSGRHIQPRFPK